MAKKRAPAWGAKSPGPRPRGPRDVRGRFGSERRRKRLKRLNPGPKVDLGFCCIVCWKGILKISAPVLEMVVRDLEIVSDPRALFARVAAAGKKRGQRFKVRPVLALDRGGGLGHRARSFLSAGGRWLADEPSV